MAAFLTIDPDDRRPIYQQVADGIKGLIARGELKDGMNLPPVRQLASDLGVNLNTIAVAYRQLQDEGLLSIRHGSGATLTASTISAPSDEELRRPLRVALTQLVIAGLPRTKIMSLVSDELQHLLKGAQ
jgi:GntR family transcriptional regulator